MDLLGWLKKKPSDPVAAMLDAYQKLPYRYRDRLSTHPEARAILDSPPDVQVAVIHAALERISQPGVGYPYWRLVTIVKALLRRRQPFSTADIQLLVTRLLAVHESWWQAMLAVEVLRAVSAHAERHGLPPEVRESLRSLRAGVLTLPRAEERRKAAALLETLLGPEPEALKTQPPSPEEDEDPAALQGEAEALAEAYVREAAAQWRPRVVRGIQHGLYYPTERSTLLDPSDSEAGRRLLASAPPVSAAAFRVIVCRYLDVLEQHGGWTYTQPEPAAVRRLADALAEQTPNLGPSGARQALRLLVKDDRIWRHMWEVRKLLVSVLEQVEADRLLPHLRSELEALRIAGEPHTGQHAVREVLVLLDRLLSNGRPSPIEAVEAWGCAAQEAFERMESVEREQWRALLVHARSASGSKPSARWLARARPLLETVGEPTFRARLAEWLGYLKVSPATPVAEPRAPISPLTLTESNLALLKGLVWTCSLIDVELLDATLAQATAECFKKVPGSGPRAIAVGNACIQALGTVNGPRGIQRLQWLRHRVTYIPSLRLIEAQLEQAAERAGLTKEELEELLVPTFGLVEGRRRDELGDYTADVALGRLDRVELRWSKADGTPLRTEPAAVRRDFGDELKELKGSVAELRKVLPTQRARLEGLFLADRSWPLRDWRERYLDHGLLAQLARRLIWWFGAGEQLQSGIWLDGRLVDAEDHPLERLLDDAPVRLWHPIGVDPAAVLAWREWLERHEVTQPFKQAHREVYIITDAELRTFTYSNRFAAHILRQHQMHALAQQRGWKAPLALVYDGAWDTTLSLALPRWNLQADFLVSCALDDAEGLTGYNDNGVCLYVTTDQVRFARLDSGAPVRLAEVPALLFSEMMRDVDLFVGVASIGNDPTWYDRGTAGHGTYWQHYSFGELGEAAKTRRAVLERLLPRLTIAPRCTLADRFLLVRGDLRTYKIHLGSGNILMEPNGQYLCIVPDRGGRAENRFDTVFLPFEGDATLAVILSKAFLLAEDRKISDPTITRQIGST